MSRILVQTEHIVAEEDDVSRIVTVTRSSVPAGSGELLLAAYRELAAKVGPHHREWALFIDARAAPGKNEPGFEGSVAKLTGAAQKQFKRVVVLVATAVGELQAR